VGNDHDPVSPERRTSTSDFWLGIRNLAAFRAPLRNPLQALALVPVPLLLFFLATGLSFGFDVGVKIGMVIVAVVITVYLLLLIPWLIVNHPTSLFGENTQLRWQEMQLFGTNQHAISAGAIVELPATRAEDPHEPQPPLPPTNEGQ
jgi:hypothetical protein